MCTRRTPALANSLLDLTPDETAPTLASISVLDLNVIRVTFTENIDSTVLMNATYLVSGGLSVSGKSVSGSYATTITLTLSEDLIGSTLYVLSVSGISDCFGNVAEMLMKEFARTELPELGDLAVNEILFNPVTGGADFVEVKNLSNKLINVNTLRLANVSGSSIANFRQVTADFILANGELVVFTPDSNAQKATYPFAVPGRFVQMSLPSYTNEASTVVLLRDTLVLDSISYSRRWHFQLIDDVKGKSLERIDPRSNANDPRNWHTAAESVGFATPGAENSQYTPEQDMSAFGFTNSVFSPDMDGVDDVLQVNYRMIAPGYVGTMTIFDDRGRQVLKLMNNELLGNSGNVVWDGVNAQNTKAPIGTYVLYFEAYDISIGAVFSERNVFVLAGRFSRKWLCSTEKQNKFKSL